MLENWFDWLTTYLFFFSLVLSRVDPLHPLWHFGKDLCKDLPHQFEECPVMVSCGHVGGDHCGSVMRCPGQHVGVSIQTAAAVVEVLDVLSQAAVRGGEGTTDSGDGAATSRWKPMTMQHIDWSLVLTLDLKGIHVHMCILYLYRGISGISMFGTHLRTFPYTLFTYRRGQTMVIYDSCSVTHSPRKVSWLEVSQTISRTVRLIPAKHNKLHGEWTCFS